MTRPSRRPVAEQARVLWRIRTGMMIRDAMLAECYSPRTIERWRDRYPDFAAALAQAKRDARAMRPGKHELLSAMMGGLSMPRAARAAGVSRSAPTNWRRTDPGFASEYERLTARRRAATVVRRERFLAALASGCGVVDACAAVGYHTATPYRWRHTSPALYARFRALVERKA